MVDREIVSNDIDLICINIGFPRLFINETIYLHMFVIRKRYKN